jgi:glycosyltransferase involved in cell wall biosynthesis/O-antigen/teichoic acid export membrane protein
VGHLVLVPLYLKYWPATRYGEWLALSSLASYLSTLDVGLNTAGVNRLTQAYARGNREAYARYQDSAIAFYTVLAGGGSIVWAVLVWQLPLGSWLTLSQTPDIEAAWVTWLLGVQVLLAMPVGFLAGVYRSVGNLAWAQWLANARTLAAFALVPLVLGLGGGMRSLAAAQLIPLGLLAGFVLWHRTRRYPELTPTLREARLSALRDLFTPSLLIAVWLLGNMIALQGSVLLVSAEVGGAAVALFVTSRTLTSLVRQVVFTANNALWPHLTALEAIGDYRRLQALHHLLVTVSSALTTAVGACLWFIGGEVIAGWTGGRLEPDTILLRLLVVQVVLEAPWLASSVMPVAFNRPRTVAFATLSASVGGIALAALLIGRFGTWAVPMGRIVAEAIACYVFIPRDCCRQIRADYWAVARRHGVALMVGMALAGTLAGAASELVSGPTPLRWLAVSLAALIGSVVPAWTIGLRAGERALVRRHLTPLLDRGRSAGLAPDQGNGNHPSGAAIASSAAMVSSEPASVARPPASSPAHRPPDGRVAVVAHHPFWMFDHAREIRRRGWDVSVFTQTPSWMIDASAATRVKVQLGWATWVQALRRLGRLGIYPPESWVWFMERQARPQFGRWVSRQLEGIRLVDALSSWGVECATAIHRQGGRYVCSRGSTHILFQHEILEEEYARWSSGRPQGFFDWRIERELNEYAMADAIAVPSRFVLRSFLERGVPPEKLHLCPYGVDLSRYSRHPRQDDVFRILFVGSVSVRKGIGYLLEAVRPLARRRRVELWLVGAVSRDAAPLLARNADLFEHRGFVPPEKLAQTYSQGSVLVLPSVEEGLARVQAQAMACGVPVIATPNTGSEDLFTDGVEGFIVPVRDARAIRDRIEWLLEHPAERERMGFASEQRVKSRSGWEAYGSAVERMYQALLARA